MNLFAENLWIFASSSIHVIFLPRKPCSLSNVTCSKPVLAPSIKSGLVFVAFSLTHLPEEKQYHCHHPTLLNPDCSKTPLTPHLSFFKCQLGIHQRKLQARSSEWPSRCSITRFSFSFFSSPSDCLSEIIKMMP